MSLLSARKSTAGVPLVTPEDGRELYEDGPTLAMLAEDGSPWYLEPDVRRHYLELAADRDQVWKHRINWRDNTNRQFFGYHEQVRRESRRRAGLPDQVEPAGLGKPEPGPVAPGVDDSEPYFIHICLSDVARQRADNDASNAGRREQYQRSHLCAGCGEVRPDVVDLQLPGTRHDASRPRLCPPCALVAGQLIGERQAARSDVRARLTALLNASPSGGRG